MKTGIKRFFSRVGFNLMLLLLFIVLSILTLHVLQNRLLENARQMGGSLAKAYSVEEERSIIAYEMLLDVESAYLDQLLAENPSSEEIVGWLQTFTSNVQQAFTGASITPYAIIENEVVSAEPLSLPEDYDPTEAEWYKQAIEADGEIVFSDAYIDAVFQKPVVTIARYCKHSGSVMVFDIFPDQFQTESSFQELPDGSAYYLCDQQGTLLYSESSLQLDQQELQSYLTQLVEQVKAEAFDENSYTIDPEGRRRGVYYDELHNGWISIVTIPYSELLGDFWTISWCYIAAIGVFLLFTLLMSIRQYRLEKRIRRTNDTVRVLGNSYYAIYRIDFAKQTYDMIKGSDYLRARLPVQGDYNEFLKVAGEVIEENAFTEFVRSFSLENIHKLVSQRVRDYGGDFRRKFDNGYRWVNIRLLFDESLDKNEVVLCFREVEEEKQLQLQQLHLLENALDTAHQNEESRNQFFSSMSHDMRTPLNQIIGTCELARQHLQNKEQIEGDILRIDQSSRQLLNLINDILEMSRLQKGKMSLSIEPTDLVACISECTGLFEPQAQREGKHFEVSFSVQNRMVYADAFRLSQVVNNLVSNAIKFTPRGGKISVEVQQVELQKYAKYKLIVSDTGAGMSQEFLGKIFIPYERETRFGAKNIAGTGLGMPIVKSIVSQMNGEITVESELGKGSVFTVLLPFETMPEESAPSLPQPPKETELPDLAGKRILLAEDNEINMEIASELLSMNGLEVVKAWNGREAVEIFRQSTPFYFDAILMDMQMPEMDGCEAAKAIRALPRKDAATLPILAVTANAFAEDIAATAEAGMNAHISKPIDFPALCKTLANLIKPL